MIFTPEVFSAMTTFLWRRDILRFSQTCHEAQDLFQTWRLYTVPYESSWLTPAESSVCKRYRGRKILRLHPYMRRAALYLSAQWPKLNIYGDNTESYREVGNHIVKLPQMVPGYADIYLGESIKVCEKRYMEQLRISCRIRVGETAVYATLLGIRDMDSKIETVNLLIEQFEIRLSYISIVIPRCPIDMLELLDSGLDKENTHQIYNSPKQLSLDDCPPDKAHYLFLFGTHIPHEAIGRYKGVFCFFEESIDYYYYVQELNQFQTGRAIVPHGVAMRNARAGIFWDDEFLSPIHGCFLQEI